MTLWQFLTKYKDYSKEIKINLDLGIITWTIKKEK